MNLTPIQEGVCRTIFSSFIIASIIIGIIIGFNTNEGVFEAFIASLAAGTIIGYVVTALVIWIMKGFSNHP